MLLRFGDCALDPEALVRTVARFGYAFVGAVSEEAGDAEARFAGMLVTDDRRKARGQTPCGRLTAAVPGESATGSTRTGRPR